MYLHVNVTVSYKHLLTIKEMSNTCQPFCHSIFAVSQVAVNCKLYAVSMNLHLQSK